MLIPRKVLSSLVVASGTGSSRYSGGLRIERGPDGKAVAAATDGRRMIYAEWDDEAMSKDVPTVGTAETAAIAESDFSKNGTILSVDTCKLIARAAKPKASAVRRRPQLGYVVLEEGSANGSVKLAASDGESVSEATVTPLEGRFPRFREVIPEYKERVSHFTLQDAETNLRQVGGCRAAAKLCEETQQVHFPGRAAVRVRLDAKYLAELADAIHKMAGSCEDSGLTLIVPLDPTCPVVLEKETEDITVRSVLMPLSE